MQDAVSTVSRADGGWVSALAARARAEAPTFTGLTTALISSLLLILSFPDFNLWPLAWVALVPVLVLVARGPMPGKAFLLGWLAGTVFFYGSCHWLTYSMIHYGGIPRWVAYLLLLPGALILGFFPGVFALVLARAIEKWGIQVLLVAPFVWSALEWARLSLTGQLWNAIGYSQAYQPMVIQSARWGGVYAVGFLVVAVNAALALLVLKRNAKAAVVAGAVVASVAILGIVSYVTSPAENSDGNSGGNSGTPDVRVVALQPNVPMNPVKSADELRELRSRHVAMSENALKQLANDGTPRLVIWPESPMNFSYGGDAQFRGLVAHFATVNQTSVLFNSLEPATNDGLLNSAVLVNQQGSLIAQYDKIRLLPFGEYVPLPRWLPGANLIGAIVGDFTPGTNYALMPVGTSRAGVFICIESAYPDIARRFTAEGADVLINISNDGYLGPTAVMRQHLANAVFRAVENNRPLLRVTNTGITAYITASGQVKDGTSGFQADVRTWTIDRRDSANTFYSSHGDLFVGANATLTLLLFAASFNVRRK